jgi:hypothetical protein
LSLWVTRIRSARCYRPYERLNITGVKGLTEEQKTTLHALEAIEFPSDRHQMMREQKTIRFSHLSVPQDLQKGSKWK